MLRKSIVTLLLTVSGFAAVAPPVTAQGSGSDEVILDMQQAFRRGDKRRLAQALPLARGNPLEPWAAYWTLKSRLDEASPAEVQDFFNRYAGTYQEDRLRADWLLLLGSRRDWTTFEAEYPRYRMNDEREVRCYALLVQHIKTGPASGPELAREVRRNWFQQRDADDGCTLAASRLIDTGQLTPADVWRRARLAMEANRPKAARDAVHLVSVASMSAVTELAANPARYLTSRAVASGRAHKELIVLALARMAANDPDSTARLLDDKWSVQLNAEQRGWAWGVIGRQAAQRLSDNAVDYFSRARDVDLSDDMLAWKTRAALRSPNSAEKWALVVRTIDDMSETLRRDPAWVYWRARGLKARGTPQAFSEAAAQFESIASPRGFYEQLALEELGRRIEIPPAPAPLQAAEREAARAHPGLTRALRAIALGLRSEGVREWNYSTNLAAPGGMSERELLAAADLACEREVWDRCINTSERTPAAFDATQRYPMPFREAVVRRSREIGLDPAYVYGLIRQESRFVMDARSGVGASGLMQVMPATARWTARKIGMTGFTTDQLTDRDVNIAIGTGYLKLVLDDFDASMPLAAAAYNAGPGRPRNWRNGRLMEGAIWIENIPFNETRDYVKKVLSNTTTYAAILSSQPQSLKARLGVIGPRDASAPEPYRDLP